MEGDQMKYSQEAQTESNNEGIVHNSESFASPINATFLWSCSGTSHNSVKGGDNKERLQGRVMLFQFFEEEKQRAKAYIGLNSQRYTYCPHHHWAPIDKAWPGQL